MMVALYIIIGIAVGAVVLYLLMDRRMDALRIAGGKADIELKMKTEQLAEKTSRVQHLETENRDHVRHHAAIEGCYCKYAEGHQRKPEGVGSPFSLVPRADAYDDAADSAVGREGREPYQRVAPRQQSQRKHG